MKKLFTKSITALLLVTSLSANAADILLSPAYTVVSVAQSLVVTLILPGATIAATSNLKEEIKSVQADAINFLAGDEVTENLISVFNQMRELDTSFTELSDEEIASKIIEINI